MTILSTKKREPHFCNSLIYSGVTGNRTRDTRIFSPLLPKAYKYSVFVRNPLSYDTLLNFIFAVFCNTFCSVYKAVYISCLPRYWVKHKVI